MAGGVGGDHGDPGKGAGCRRGFIAGSTTLRDYLVHKARSFVFSTAPVPAASAQAALRVVASDEGDLRRSRLWDRGAAIARRPWETGLDLPAPVSPIVPLPVGDEERAVRLADRVREAGLIVPAIRHPTVQRGRARLRITLSAAHEPEDVDRLLFVLRQAVAQGDVVTIPARPAEE